MREPLHKPSDGEKRIAWAAQAMPVLELIESRFEADRPLAGLKTTLCLHVTAETARLALTLRTAGAKVAICAAHPLSGDTSVAQALQKRGIPTWAKDGATPAEHRQQIREALAHRPQLVIDNSGLAIAQLHEQPELLANVLGGTLETRAGVQRLRGMAEGELGFPVIAVDEAKTKQLFDSRLGTGQSAIDGILRATGRLLAGSVFVVLGYGDCGKGVAERARGMGARVIVTEIDPIRALRASLDGYQVLPMAQAAKVGDFFCAATGTARSIRPEHFEAMRDGAIVANVGLYDEELDLRGLAALARPKRVRALVDEYLLPSGRRVSVLAEGALVNLVAGEGHPAALMDLSFSNLALCLEYLAGHANSLARKVYAVPDALDQEIARMKLRALGIRIDRPTRPRREAQT